MYSFKCYNLFPAIWQCAISFQIMGYIQYRCCHFNTYSRIFEHYESEYYIFVTLSNS